MTGDVLLHYRLWTQAERDARPGADIRFATSGPWTGPMDFSGVFAGQKPLVGSADLAICHLETQLAPPGGPYAEYPAFSVPPYVLTAIREVGYDACTTGSNHALDHGFAGLSRTLDLLDAAGLRHTGTARSKTESVRPLLLDAGGVRVALLEYAYGTNGIPLPAGKPWSVHLIDTARILRDAHAARGAGAQVVLVALHAGTEYQHAPSRQQLDVVRTLLASPDIDLVYGHHVHVVQPFQRMHGKWVAYGLGNTVANMARSRTSMDTREEVMARFTFTRRAGGRFMVSKAEFVPSYMPFEFPIRWLDLGVALKDPSLPVARRSEYQRAYDDIVRTVDALGAAQWGLTPVG